MKRKFLYIAIVVVLIFLGIILYFTRNNTNELTLTYKTNGGVPYEWKYEIGDTYIVKFVKSYESDNQNKNGMVGAPINVNYVFKGLKEGTTTITFKYVNIVDNTVEKEVVNKVKVDGNKNIYLKK